MSTPAFISVALPLRSAGSNIRGGSWSEIRGNDWLADTRPASSTWLSMEVTAAVLSCISPRARSRELRNVNHPSRATVAINSTATAANSNSRRADRLALSPPLPG